MKYKNFELQEITWNLKVDKPITKDYNKIIKIHKPITIESQNFLNQLKKPPIPPPPNKSKNLIVDEGRIKTKWKMCLAILAVVLCVIVATLFLYHYEKLDSVDSVYLSVILVAMV